MIVRKLSLRPVRAARLPFCAGASAPSGPGKTGLVVAGCLMAIALTALSVSSPAAVPAARTGAAVPVQADACLPLLKVANQGPAHTPYPHPSAALPLPDGEAGRDAGAALALSLIFGVRNATGPKESGTRPRPDQAADDSAVRVAAVTAYRRCMNQKTLEALNAAYSPPES